MRNSLAKRLFIAVALSAAAVPSIPLFCTPAVAKGDRSGGGDKDRGDHGGLKDGAGNGNARVQGTR